MEIPPPLLQCLSSFCLASPRGAWKSASALGLWVQEAGAPKHCGSLACKSRASDVSWNSKEFHARRNTKCWQGGHEARQEAGSGIRMGTLSPGGPGFSHCAMQVPRGQCSGAMGANYCERTQCPGRGLVPHREVVFWSLGLSSSSGSILQPLDLSSLRLFIFI